MNAQEMFEELGYKIIDKSCIAITYKKKSTLKDNIELNESIMFHNQPNDKYKDVQFLSDYDSRCEWEEENKCLHCMCENTINCSKNKKGYNLIFIDTKLHQAIHQQMKELGWL